jgi:hypothetical protein
VRPGLQRALAPWRPDVDNAPVRIGDAHAARASARRGVKWVSSCIPLPWTLSDAELH